MDFLKNLSASKLELILTILSIILILTIPQFGVIIAFIIVIIYLRRGKNKKELRESIGLRRPKSPFFLFLISLILGVLIEITTESILNPMIEKMTSSKIDLSKIVLHNVGEYILWVVIGFILGGLLEEILFRGFLLTRISRFIKCNKTNDILAVIITATLFGICHLYQGMSGIISTAIIGFLLGIIFLSFKKNLWYAILTHGFINLTGLTILYFGYYDKIESIFF